MIEKLVEEIRRKYPEQSNVLLEEINNRKYTLHCSQSFKGKLVASIFSEVGNINYVKDGVPQPIDITALRYPSIGLINIVVDRKRGHKIEKDEASR